MENTNRNFKGIWIPSELWLDKELSIQEKVILVEIDSLSNETDGCYASNKYFADFFNLSNGRISQIINDLNEKGWIDIEIETKGKQIIKRYIKIKKTPYSEVFNKLNKGIKNIKEGYLENDKDNNIIYNKINNNIYIVEEIVNYLNEKLGTKYKSTSSNTQKHIKARLNEGFTLDDFKSVIDKKYNEWNGTNMQMYLRPETLFGTKFESYLNTNNTTYKNKKYERMSLDENWN